MKIISLALLHKGFNDNQLWFKATKNLNSIPPHPECTRPNDRISFIKVQFNGQIIHSRIFTPFEALHAFADEEYYKEYFYLNLIDDVMSIIREQFNNEVIKFLGEKV